MAAVAPHDMGEGRGGDDREKGPATQGPGTLRGISFENWLDLFLDYAIGLAVAQRREEAYQICQAARDSTAFQSAEHRFAIYVVWSVCAIYTSDEEKCVATARQLMREETEASDSYRMFALVSRLCQSPVSWYTSGPAQKFILRQIKAMDERRRHEWQLWSGAGKKGQKGSEKEDGEAEGEEEEDINTGRHGSQKGAMMDVCLMMLYGHILFTSTSYAYSLGKSSS